MVQYKFSVQTPVPSDGHGQDNRKPTESWRPSDELCLNVAELNNLRNGAAPVHTIRGTGITSEPLPRLDHYRTSTRWNKRPSLGELYGDDSGDEYGKQEPEIEEQPVSSGHAIRLGWIQGVLTPCLLNIWGVMLFLRLSWVVAEAGVIQTLLIMVLSYVVCVITTLSLSALCTNGQVKSGGIYYIISRSLGPEFGASVGVIFAFANAVNASMNTIGFCSSLNDLLRSNGLQIVDGSINDIRIVGTIALLVMVTICAVGMDWEVKAQNFLLVAILLAIASFIIGAAMGPTHEDEIAKGFIGFSAAVFTSNLAPGYRFSEGVQQNFFSVFAVFFPSVTGIQSGANICGDLKDPATAIPKGTLLACLVSGISYIVFSLFAGASALRDASGNVTDLVGINFTSCSMELNNCNYGLNNDYSIMQLMAFSSELIYLGCWAATLSTALTNLLSVPRLIQALGIDRIYPGLIFFSKGYGKHGEPYRGYVLVFFVSFAFIMIADLNTIAPLISNFFLASYSLVNFCTFHAATVKPLGWRPTFRYYHPWLSMFGSLLCVAIMFLIDVVSTFITIAIIFILYLTVIYRKPDVNWGSSTQAAAYKSALNSALNLEQVGEHVKNYNPQLLVLTGNPILRPGLLNFAHLITKNNSLMIVGNVVETKLSYKQRKALITSGKRAIKDAKIKAFYNILDGLPFDEAVRAMIQSSGFGKLTPNILFVGYKTTWRTCSFEELNNYYNILHYAFDNRLALAILRLPDGIDCSDIINCHVNPVFDLSDTSLNVESTLSLAKTPTGRRLQNSLMPINSNLDLRKAASTSEQSSLNMSNGVYQTPIPQALPNTNKEMRIFREKQPAGIIDVWWLYDDGGLTILLPYIISTRTKWSDCQIRIFALASQKEDFEEERQNMTILLDKLRIKYVSLIMVTIADKPQETTISSHRALIDTLIEEQETDRFVSEAEQRQLLEKTYRQLRLRELLLQYSEGASLIVMSMPIPRKGIVSAQLYMSWLEMLTENMPPFLLVRGNQTSVLTFYS
ncbi:bumetanide-sensitive sodium-(potassium)-chloride cotransporter-like isoform X2 [Toxorhynchites rutilus septentrionalis]|uniref:bumetanide-sensitive sodium-(potassium)-chloride cotransporter-like isoform X2 n=1 Tax=Toxorhynchites rutilus septentrionalis TaxID=329112 RepID=UPI00247988D7|nr:bumetanide-sensitive sodium-(potassium)-chloride cotransporter-like isoform X2 [Toxorhynchites rutilus septentrionalis]